MYFHFSWDHDLDNLIYRVRHINRNNVLLHIWNSKIYQHLTFWMLSANFYNERSDSVIWQKNPYTNRILGEKGRNLTLSFDKSPLHRQKIQQATWQHKNADYTTIADRLRTVNWGNDSHPTGVIKPVYGIPTFPLTAEAVNQKNTHLKMCK